MRQLLFQYSVQEWRHWTMPYALRAILKDFAEPMHVGVLNRVPLPSMPTRPLDDAISIAGHFQKIFSEPMHMGTTTPNFMLAGVYVRYPHPKKLGCATLRADQSACLLCALQKPFGIFGMHCGSSEFLVYSFKIVLPFGASLQVGIRRLFIKHRGRSFSFPSM